MDPNKQIFSPSEPQAPHTPYPAPAPGAPQMPSPTAPLPGADAPPLTAPSSQPPADIHPKKSKKHLVLGGVLAALVVVLLGASAAAYYIVMNKPQNVLNLALMNSFSADKVQSMNFSGTLGYTPKDGDGASATFEGAANDDGAFEFTSKYGAPVTNVTVDARSVDGKTFYLRMGGLDGLAALLGGTENPYMEAYLAPIIKTVNNQWVEVNASMVEQLIGVSTDIGSSKLGVEDRNKLAGIYKQNQFLVVSKALEDEKIGTYDSRHYQLVIDGGKLKSFVTAVKDAKIKSLPMDNDSVKEFNAAVDKADLKEYPFEIWISKGDKMVRQVAFAAEDGDSGDTVSVKLAIDEYNKPVKVEKPAETKTLLEIMSELIVTDALDSLDLSSGTGSLEDLGISL